MKQCHSESIDVEYADKFAAFLDQLYKDTKREMPDVVKKNINSPWRLIGNFALGATTTHLLTKGGIAAKVTKWIGLGALSVTAGMFTWVLNEIDNAANISEARALASRLSGEGIGSAQFILDGFAATLGSVSYTSARTVILTANAKNSLLPGLTNFVDNNPVTFKNNTLKTIGYQDHHNICYVSFTASNTSEPASLSVTINGQWGRMVYDAKMMIAAGQNYASKLGLEGASVKISGYTDGLPVGILIKGRITETTASLIMTK